MIPHLFQLVLLDPLGNVSLHYYWFYPFESVSHLHNLSLQALVTEHCSVEGEGCHFLSVHFMVGFSEFELILLRVDDLCYFEIYVRAFGDLMILEVERS